eukprot:jgi/Orpsp1_1/1190674/evm.model.d7180000080441.1
MKRLKVNEIQDSSELHRKKIKIIDNIDLIEIFDCSNFYIDKSLLIKDFLEEKSKTVCVTRPSGYGKTVNLTMLNKFFEMNYENNKISENRKYFENLNIAKEVKDGESYIDRYQGQYPVVFLNFEKFRIKNSYKETIENFRKFIVNLYNKYYKINIENLTIGEKKYWKNFFEDIPNVDEDDIINSISFLFYFLKKLLKKEIILLIDNYDSPILNAINTEFFDKFYFFYFNVFKIIFKNNKRKNYLFKTFITGIVNAQYFYKFNPKNYSITDNKYNKYYSITDSELKELILMFKLDNKCDLFEKYCYNNT